MRRAIEKLADAVVVLWGWRRLAVALVAGAVSALAFAPFNLFPLLWLTVPVFVWLLDGAEAGEGAGWFRRLVPAAAIGFAFGFGFFLAGLWWVGAAFLVDADEFAWLLPVAVVLLPAILAAFWALGAVAARLVWVEGWPRILVFAVAMASAEWLRGHAFTGFPWNAFGYALTPFPLMMQSASVVGIWGLTLAAFLMFAAPALLGDRWVGRGARVVLAASVVLMGAHVGFGALRLALHPAVDGDGVHVRIVQPAIAQDRRWSITAADEIMERYVELSRSGETGLDGVQLLVWPESAFPFLLTERPSALAAIADLLPAGTTLITGAARAERGTGEESPPVFNSVYVIDDGGEIRDAYDKVHLVPFGEYLPFRGALEAIGLRQLVALPGGFAAGQRLRSLALPDGSSFGPLICYEVIFPAAVTEPGRRPDWLLNVTNDGWYGNTPGPYQHFLQARVRAVEEGLPLVRAANSGISAIVDANGRALASLELGRAGTLDGNLPQALSPTPYAALGDLIFLGLLLVGAMLPLLAKFTR